MKKKTYLIIGASRGLGKAFFDGLPEAGDKVFTVSRNAESGQTNHIPCDLRSLDCADRVKDAIGETPVDTLIYNAGIWEKDTFENSNDQFLCDIINVNLTNAMLITKSMLPNLRSGQGKKIIFIGSTAGLDHYPTDGIAYAAAKSGLRGLTNGLRQYLRPDGIAVTCILPGSMATDIDFAEGEKTALDRYESKRIPVSDIVKIIKNLIDLSPAACVKEIILPAQFDSCP